MFRVFYDKTDSTLIKYIQHIADLIEEFPTDPLPFRLACGIAGAIKRPSFRHENEWRILIYNPPPEEMSFRQGPKGIIPYINLRWKQTVGDSPLREVLCCAQVGDNEPTKTITWMLNKYGYALHPPVNVRAVKRPVALE